MATVYTINKGINKPIEFKGLKAQYIGWLAAGLLCLLILFAIFYVLGVNTYISLVLILLLGVGLFMTVYHYSNTYGAHGLMKLLARKRIPKMLRASSRTKFIYAKGLEQ
jgi:hypothetical protein